MPLGYNQYKHQGIIQFCGKPSLIDHYTIEENKLFQLIVMIANQRLNKLEKRKLYLYFI